MPISLCEPFGEYMLVLLRDTSMALKIHCSDLQTKTGRILSGRMRPDLFYVRRLIVV